MPKKDLAAFFDSYARDFNAIYGTTNSALNKLLNSCFRKSMRLRFIKTLEGCQPILEKTVLDVGCGPGHYAVALATLGAHSVVGVDFSKEMLALARTHAEKAGVIQRCKFICSDFLSHPLHETFDYTVLMGVMDYCKEPQSMIEKVLSLTTDKAFFSFPVGRGFLAWQRRIRYRSRCDLFMYDLERIHALFKGKGYGGIAIERVSRDFFVTVHCGAAR